MYRSLTRHRHATPVVRFAAVLCALLPAVLTQARTPPSADDVDWSALTLGDIDAMHALLRDNTPVPFDTENPQYLRWLEEGHAMARARAAQVTDRTGHSYTLSGYAQGFRDPHFSVQLDMPAAVRWPGFVAVQRGDTAVVVQRDADDPSAPALGSHIETCNGQPLPALVQSRIRPFSVAAGLPDRWATHLLFLDHQNPFVQMLASCSVRSGAELVKLPLRWRAISGVDQTFAQQLTNTIFGSAAPWGLSEPEPGVFWIGVPTFIPEGESIAQLRALVAAIKARGAAMRNARAIIIDTRHNSGGFVFWSQQLAEAIFTPQVLASAAKPARKRRIAYDKRVSAGNVAFKREKLQQINSDLSSGQKRHSSAEIAQLERGIERNTPMLREGARTTSATGGLAAQRPRGGKPPFPAQVLFLSNGTCFSSCLLFADQALMVPGVRLIGSVTAADTGYMDIRREKLPSGLATLSFPQTVMRGRGRGALEAYAPDIPYTGSWDDASVRAWTLSLIGK